MFAWLILFASGSVGLSPRILADSLYSCMPSLCASTFRNCMPLDEYKFLFSRTTTSCREHPSVGFTLQSEKSARLGYGEQAEGKGLRLRSGWRPVPPVVAAVATRLEVAVVAVTEAVTVAAGDFTVSPQWRGTTVFRSFSRVAGCSPADDGAFLVRNRIGTRARESSLLICSRGGGRFAERNPKMKLLVLLPSECTQLCGVII